MHIFFKHLMLTKLQVGRGEGGYHTAILLISVKTNPVDRYLSTLKFVAKSLFMCLMLLKFDSLQNGSTILFNQSCYSTRDLFSCSHFVLFLHPLSGGFFLTTFVFPQHRVYIFLFMFVFPIDIIERNLELYTPETM